MTAEGVEDELSWQMLAVMSADVVQGYHLSRPLPPDAVTRLITERAALEVAPPLPQLRVVEGLAR